MLRSPLTWPARMLDEQRERVTHDLRGGGRHDAFKKDASSLTSELENAKEENGKLQAGRYVDDQAHTLQMEALRKEHASAFEKLHAELKSQEVRHEAGHFVPELARITSRSC